MVIENGILVKVKNSDIKNGIIVIPKNVTKIGDGAFMECTESTNIEIPDSITEIYFIDKKSSIQKVRI